MIEKLISLKGVEPKMLYGVHNKLFSLISDAFPKLKLVSRGSTLLAKGEKEEIAFFENKLEVILDYLQTYNSVTAEDMQLLLKEGSERLELKNGDKKDILAYSITGRPVKARTPHQKELVEKYVDNDLLIAVGPAGTGKTYTAIALAVRALKNKEVKKIVLTRPAVEAGEHLGFLPGDVRDKLDPYLQPLYDALRDMIPAKKLNNLIEDQIIQIAPLAFMRGRTLENAFVVMDEAQNTTLNQFKMFLTRMGMNSKFIVTGDITQIDLPRKRESGLVLAMEILGEIEGLSVILFGEKDILRHRLVKDIVKAYDQHIEKDNPSMDAE